VNQFIGSLLVVIIITYYTLKITIIITHVRSSIHTLSLHTSSTNFPWLSPAENWSELSKSNSIATDGESVSKSWCRAPSGTRGQIFITIWQLRSCFCREPSLTRGRVCLLCMLLALASAVFLASETLGTRDHIFLSQIRDFLFVASYDSQGHGGSIRPRLHTGISLAHSRTKLLVLFSLYNVRTDHAQKNSSIVV
jgi:hypothetical protein